MDSFTASEQERFEAYWDNPGSRNSSLGERRVTDACESLHLVSGDTVIDYGCGTGRAALKFMDRGIDVIGIDIAANCLDPAVSIPLVKASLWDLPESLSSSGYAFCANVLDVVPEVKVGDVVAAIESRTDHAAFFSLPVSRDEDADAVAWRWCSLLSSCWPYVDQVRVESSVDLVCRRGVIL